MKVLAILLPALASLAAGQKMQLRLDTSQTQVDFKLGDVLHTVHGTFKLKSADLWFDPSTSKAGGQIVVNALSGESGNSGRDTRMHKNVLESMMFPEITFVPVRLEEKLNLDGDSTVRLRGQFTLHGVSHKLIVRVQAHVDHQRLTAEIHFPVPYVQWGLKNPSTLLLRVNDTVDIAIHTSGELNPATP